MLGSPSVLNEQVLARVKCPRRRLLLQDAMEAEDRALEDMLRTEAEARDKLRAAEAKSRSAPRTTKTRKTKAKAKT